MRPGNLRWFSAILLTWSLSELGRGIVETPAQAPIRGVGKGFRASETDAQGGQVKFHGQSYRTLPDGRLQLTGMVIETQRGTNASTIVEAPESILDLKSKVAFSTNRISIRTTDDRFFVDGTGFQYQWLDSGFTVSNEVHTVIRKPARGAEVVSHQTTNATHEVLKPVTPGVTNQALARVEPIDIHSDRLDYRPEIATFTGNVRAKDEQGNVRCGILKALFEPGGNNVRRIEAEQNVAFEQGDTRTTAGQAVYLPAEDIVTLPDKPVWKSGDREGSSEVLVVNNKTREIRADRDVNVKLPPHGMLPLDWFPGGAATNTLNETNRWAKIHSDKLNYRPSGALFQGDVRVLDSQGAELKCGLLTNTFSVPDGKLIQLLVRDNVVFKQGDAIVRADQGTYETNSEFITLTGNPIWKTKQGEGRGDVVLVNPKTRQIHAERNASMKMVGSGLESLDLSLHPNGTNSLVRTNQEFVIISGEVFYRSGSAIFLHDVRVTSPQEPQHELRSEVLAAFFVGSENKLDELVAEENVQIRQGDLRAAGDKVVYLVPKGILELTGHPQINEPGRKYTGDKFILNRINNTFRAVGKYRIELERGAVALAIQPAVNAPKRDPMKTHSVK